MSPECLHALGNRGVSFEVRRPCTTPAMALRWVRHEDRILDQKRQSRHALLNGIGRGKQHCHTSAIHSRNHHQFDTVLKNGVLGRCTQRDDTSTATNTMFSCMQRCRVLQKRDQNAHYLPSKKIGDHAETTKVRTSKNLYGRLLHPREVGHDGLESAAPRPLRLVMDDCFIADSARLIWLLPC